MKKNFLILVLVLLLAAIFLYIINLNDNPSSETVNDESSCREQGGMWAKFGLLGTWMCNFPTTDKDKTCFDSNECESFCITEETDLRDIETAGKCYGWTITLGTCLNFVEGGRTQGTICFD